MKGILISFSNFFIFHGSSRDAARDASAVRATHKMSDFLRVSIFRRLRNDNQRDARRKRQILARLSFAGRGSSRETFDITISERGAPLRTTSFHSYFNSHPAGCRSSCRIGSRPERWQLLNAACASEIRSANWSASAHTILYSRSHFPASSARNLDTQHQQKDSEAQKRFCSSTSHLHSHARTASAAVRS